MYITYIVTEEAILAVSPGNLLPDMQAFSTCPGRWGPDWFQLQKLRLLNKFLGWGTVMGRWLLLGRAVVASSNQSRGLVEMASHQTQCYKETLNPNNWKWSHKHSLRWCVGHLSRFCNNSIKSVLNGFILKLYWKQFAVDSIAPLTGVDNSPLNTLKSSAR